MPGMCGHWHGTCNCDNPPKKKKQVRTVKPPTREEIEAKMLSWDETLGRDDSSWRKHPAWESFVNHFITRSIHYGREETSDAWYFWSRGFEAGS